MFSFRQFPYILILCVACASTSTSTETSKSPQKAKKKRRLPSRPGQPPGQAELEAAVKHARQDDLPGAIDFAKRAIAANPQLEQAYLLYGSACAMMGNAACEKEAYDSGVKALPRSGALLRELAMVHLQEGQAEQAVKHLEQAQKHGEDKPEVWADLAYAYFFAQRVDEATALAKKASSEDPKCVQCQMVLGELMTNQKKYEEAITAYSAATKLAPDDPAAARALGKAMFLSGDKKGAIKIYEKALSENPADDATRFELVKIQFTAKAYGDAAENLEILLKSNPGERNLLSLLYKAQKKAGNTKGAKATKAKLDALSAK